MVKLANKWEIGALLTFFVLLSLINISGLGDQMVTADNLQPHISFSRDAKTGGFSKGREDVINGWSGKELDSVPPRLSWLRSLLPKVEGWRGGKAGMVMVSQVEVKGLIVPGKAGEHRLGVVQFRHDWVPEKTGSYMITAKPDLLFVVGAYKTGSDLTPAEGGGASGVVSLEWRIKNRETGDTIARKREKQPVAGSKYPPEFNPSSVESKNLEELGMRTLDSLLEELAVSYVEDIVKKAIASLGGGSLLPLINVVETTQLLSSLNGERRGKLGSKEMDQPLSMEAKLKEGNKYRWELSVVGDCKAMGLSQSGKKTFAGLVAISGDLEGVEIKKSSP